MMHSPLGHHYGIMFWMDFVPYDVLRAEIDWVATQQARACGERIAEMVNDIWVAVIEDQGADVP